MPRGDRLCVVTGATGAVGPAVANRIAREADGTVVALARHAAAPGVLAARVRFEPASLFDARMLQWVREADVVIHLAAQLHVNNPSPALRDEYRRTNVEATRRLLDATRPDARFVFSSTIDVYGPTPPGALATEETVPQPRSLYGETKLEAEQIVLRHPGGVVLRLAAVYGPRMKANYARLVRALSRHRYVPVGPSRNVRTLVFEEDAGDAAWIVATAEALPSRLYNLTDGQTHTLREIVAAICAALDRRPPRWSLPVSVVRGAAVLLDGACRAMRRQSPVTPQMIDKLQENVAVSGDRLQRELGFTPRFDLGAGWREAVRSQATDEAPST